MCWRDKVGRSELAKTLERSVGQCWNGDAREDGMVATADMRSDSN